MRQFAASTDKASVGFLANTKQLLALTGFVLVVGLPTAFWMLMFELMATMFGFEYGAAARIWIAAGLVSALAAVWGLVCGAARNNLSDTAIRHSSTPALAPGTAQTTAGLSGS